MGNTEWAWQLLLLVRRWWPEREIVAVADSTYASLRLLERCRSLSNPIAFITRLMLDAALYEPAPPRRPGQMGRPRLKGLSLAQPFGGGRGSRKRVDTDETRPLVAKVSARRGGLNPAVWYSTGCPCRACALGANPRSARRVQDPGSALHRSRAKPEQIILWFVRRWQMEATFQEVRQRLGFETQRHWSDMAVVEPLRHC